MCGRFTLTVDLEAVLDLIPGLKPKFERWPGARYNVAPTQPVPTVLNDGDRALTLSRWGLIPFWAKEASIGNRMINARAESVHEKPAFRAAFRKQRCLIVADGFYEWTEVPGQRRKQPMYIRLKSGEPFAFAGLWDRWRDPEQGEDAAPIISCTIITTEPNELAAQYHNRMPVILHRDDYEAWIDPGEHPPERLLPLLQPFPADLMEAFPVSTRVNTPANDDATLVQPLDAPTALM